MATHDEDGATALRAPWSRSGGRVPRFVVQPVQKFMHAEQASGIVLLAAAVAALIWVNSPWGDVYERVWFTQLDLRLGPWVLEQDLRHWINDGLMALFFFLVGLEIKRELVTGELRDPRAAALPAFAALGGMVVPALLYVALNVGGEGADGWGVPMATDIAFALGVVAVLGRRVPAQLKLFLLALAIVDDLGAILVIAVFYTDDLALVPLGAAIGLLALIVALRKLQVRARPVYLGLGLGVWLAVFLSGVHATIAGAALGLLTPALPFQSPGGVSRRAREVADQTPEDRGRPDEGAHHWLELSELSREAVSPLRRVEEVLHPWTSFVIVPLFALANAGVTLGGGAIAEAVTNPIGLGIVLGLVVGKSAGIPLVAFAATRLGIARLPSGVGWRQVIGVAALAGIGFTVALFIAGLAFTAEQLRTAKVGILVASVLAGVLGSGLLLAGGRRDEKRAETAEREDPAPGEVPTPGEDRAPGGGSPRE